MGVCDADAGRGMLWSSVRLNEKEGRGWLVGLFLMETFERGGRVQRPARERKRERTSKCESEGERKKEKREREAERERANVFRGPTRPHTLTH